jgi:FKBP-type peptidyl-prolyl cis-trans isomerase SlpA
MSIDTSKINPGSRVRLHLAIFLEDGTEALSTFGEEPMELTLGDGTLTPGTEALLIGLPAGAEEQFIADGNELFGVWSDENMHWMPLGDFPNGEIPEPGALVVFDTPGGAETAGVIKDVKNDRVLVDFNHPLSGRALRIQVRVLDLADARQTKTTH